jgi:hypothetical protein
MRRLVVVAVLVTALIAVYLLLVRDSTVAPTVTSAQPTAVIGSGSGAVGVAADGAILTWLPAPKDGSLPRLPLSEPPKNGRLQGPMLQQALVLGATPPALRKYVESSYYGESGVDVKLKAGVELRFGDASQAARKWRAGAAVLADPAVTALDYVDLQAPGRPAISGSGHALPTAP